MKKNLIIALVAVVAMSASVAIAQTTTYEIKQGTVLHVDGNHLYVKMADGYGPRRRSPRPTSSSMSTARRFRSPS